MGGDIERLSYDGQRRRYSPNYQVDNPSQVASMDRIYRMRNMPDVRWCSRMVLFGLKIHKSDDMYCRHGGTAIHQEGMTECHREARFGRQRVRWQALQSIYHLGLLVIWYL